MFMSFGMSAGTVFGALVGAAAAFEVIPHMQRGIRRLFKKNKKKVIRAEE